MYLREAALNNIIRCLSIVQHEISIRNSVYLYDLAVHSEDFYRVLLNKIYDFNLKNLNNKRQQSAAIDLADEGNNIAIQITTNKSPKKISHSVSQFIKNNLHRRYAKLKILIVKEYAYRGDVVRHEDFVFDPQIDIIDTAGLIKILKELETSKLQEISSWLKSELTINYPESRNQPTKREIEIFFSKFTKTEFDAMGLIFGAQPTLSDCREIFTDEFYQDAYDVYSNYFYSMLDNQSNVSESLRDKSRFDIYTVKYNEISLENQHFPKGFLNDKTKLALRPSDIQYHSVSFVKSGDDKGIKFSIWTFVNGRWVFLPRPWVIIQGLHELRKNKQIKIIIRLLRFFGVHRDLEKNHSGAIFASGYIVRELLKKNNRHK